MRTRNIAAERPPAVSATWIARFLPRMSSTKAEFTCDVHRVQHAPPWKLTPPSAGSMTTASAHTCAALAAKCLSWCATLWPDLYYGVRAPSTPHPLRARRRRLRRQTGNACRGHRGLRRSAHSAAPCKLELTRAEQFAATTTRHPFRMRVTVLGATAQDVHAHRHGCSYVLVARHGCLWQSHARKRPGPSRLRRESMSRLPLSPTLHVSGRGRLHQHGSFAGAFRGYGLSQTNCSP